MENNVYKYDVFISYSRKDYVDEKKTIIPGNIVSQIKDTFDANNISYWMDEKGIYSGDEYAKIIARFIRQSRIFLFISTESSNASEWTSDEIATARMYKKKIIPFKYDDSVYNEEVIIFIAKLDFIDYPSNPEQALNKLVSSVKKYLADLEDIRKREEEFQLKKKLEEEERRKRAEEEARKERVRNEIKQKAQDCQHLIIQQQAFVQQLHAKNKSIGNETKECPICKKASSIESTFCEKCGFQFPLLYAINGDDSYPFDNQHLVVAKANFDAIAFVEKERAKLEGKVGELTASYEKLSEKCEQYPKTIAQKEAEIVSYREKCNKLSSQLKDSERLSEKFKVLEQQKKEIEKQKKEIEVRLEKLKDEKNDAVRKIKELEKKQEQYQEDSRRNQQSKNDFNQRTTSGYMSGSRWNWNSNNDFNQNFNHPIIEGALNGCFSINSIKKVCFSKGNLQYQAYNKIWRFAENQYDFIGKANESISPYYQGWIDLFGWGSGDSPDNINLSFEDFTDWGNNRISNGGNVFGVWRTLTNAQWDYLLTKRCTKSNCRFVKAQLNGINGLILFPDNWESGFYNLKCVNQGEAGFLSNIIGLAKWTTIFQPNGAVFLPAAGNRGGTYVGALNTHGYYWSATHAFGKESYSLYFHNGFLSANSGSESQFGRSVRLVCDAKLQ